MTQPKLTRIHVAGFRSLRDVTFDLTGLTVLVGPNGAGKSNLLRVFGLLRAAADGFFQLAVNREGGASFVLQAGPKAARAVSLKVELADESTLWSYEAELEPAKGDRLMFSSERVARGLSTEACSGLIWGPATERVSLLAMVPIPSHAR